MGGHGHEDKNSDDYYKNDSTVSTAHTQQTLNQTDKKILVQWAIIMHENEEGTDRRGDEVSELKSKKKCHAFYDRLSSSV